MCEKNNNSINYITKKIIDFLPKITNSNKLALFYPTMTKTMLQILSIFIKLSGKFHKSTLEELYITKYLKINNALSISILKYNAGDSEEINNHLKNEKTFFYSNCLFNSSIYLFNRFHPLTITIYILRHILELYGNELTLLPNEIESILLLKVNYNLGLFYYINGNNHESIYNLKQAREILLEIKYFPITPLKNIRKRNEDNNQMNKPTTNSTNLLFNYNEFIAGFNQNVKFHRKKYKRSSISTSLFHNNDKKIEKQNLIEMIKEKNIKTQREYELKRGHRVKQFSTIFLGANSILNLENPILLEQVREKLFIEIELLLSEIELNHKNYRESLNHINTILKMQSLHLTENNNENNKEAEKKLRQTLIAKSKTINAILNKNDSSSNGIVTNDMNKISENIKLNLKNSLPLEANLLFMDKKKFEINTNILFNKFKNMKYHLSAIDKNRIMLILEQIESANSRNQINSSDRKIRIKLNKNLIKKKANLNTDRKIITSKEMEKFFIFLCSLSIYQLKILNETQPEPSQRRNNLPIIFSNQFQDCLTNAQRMSLSILETMSLSRYIILKDTNKDICPENLDYRFMKYRIKQEDNEDEYFNIKNKSYLMESMRSRRKSSCDSIMSANTNKDDLGSRKLLSSKITDSEYEELSKNIDAILNILVNNENEKFIDLHKNNILKSLSQMSKEELQAFLNCPNLLNQMINKISKKYKIKENGGNNKRKYSSFYIGKK